jgi:hypothetical protein
MAFTDFERRWIVAIMSAFTTPEGELTVADGEADYVYAAELMAAGSRLKARVGLRVAVWVVALAPAWALGRAQTLDELPAAGRTELIARLLDHRAYLVRGLATLLKLTATLAMMRSPAVRARSGYDRAADARSPSTRRALPLVTSQGVMT